MRNYFWRIGFYRQPDEEVDADRYYIHHSGAIEFIDLVNDQEMGVVIYAPGVWSRVLLVKAEEAQNEKV